MDEPEELTKEYEHLLAVKRAWIKQYSGYARSLCNAILALGEDDDLGDPVGKQRHGMTIKSVKRSTRHGDVVMVATQSGGGYVTELKEFATTKRLIVTVGTYSVAYMTFTNDPLNKKDSECDLIVPGRWMDEADLLISDYDNHIARENGEKLKVKIAELESQLLIGIRGFGEGKEMNDRE